MLHCTNSVSIYNVVVYIYIYIYASYKSKATSVHKDQEGLSIITRINESRSVIIITYKNNNNLFYAHDLHSSLLTPGLHCFDFHLNSRPQILEQHIEHKYTVEL